MRTRQSVSEFRSSVLSSTTAAIWSSSPIDPESLADAESGDAWVWVESAGELCGTVDAKFVTTSGSESRLGSASAAFERSKGCSID